MLFHSSLRKELARSFGATLVVLATIVMTMMLVRTLGMVSRGSVNPQEVTMVLGYTVLGYMPMILILSLFISIVGTLSRLYLDSEMVIWFASGRGLAGFAAPLMRFAWPVLLVIAVLALVLWPWANQQTQDLRERYERRGDLERVTPGQFQESARGARVFFIDKDSADGRTGRNVFISETSRERSSVTSARSGRIEIVNGDRVLLLEAGQRMETSLVTGEVKISEFREYQTLVDPSVLPGTDNRPSKTRSTLELLREPTLIHQGELAWRIGLALASVNFVLLALVIASANPRVGRSGNLLFALFAFIVYFNLINLGQTWIASGRVGAIAFVAGLHGGTLALTLLWLARRHNNWSLRSWRLRMGSQTGSQTGAQAA